MRQLIVISMFFSLLALVSFAETGKPIVQNNIYQAAFFYEQDSQGNFTVRDTNLSAIAIAYEDTLKDLPDDVYCAPEIFGPEVFNNCVDFVKSELKRTHEISTYETFTFNNADVTDKKIRYEFENFVNLTKDYACLFTMEFVVDTETKLVTRPLVSVYCDK